MCATQRHASSTRFLPLQRDLRLCPTPAASLVRAHLPALWLAYSRLLLPALQANTRGNMGALLNTCYLFPLPSASLLTFLQHQRCWTYRTITWAAGEGNTRGKGGEERKPQNVKHHPIKTRLRLPQHRLRFSVSRYLTDVYYLPLRGAQSLYRTFHRCCRACGCLVRTLRRLARLAGSRQQEGWLVLPHLPLQHLPPPSLHFTAPPAQYLFLRKRYWGGREDILNTMQVLRRAMYTLSTLSLYSLFH